MKACHARPLGVGHLKENGEIPAWFLRNPEYEKVYRNLLYRQEFFVIFWASVNPTSQSVLFNTD